MLLGDGSGWRVMLEEGTKLVYIRERILISTSQGLILHLRLIGKSVLFVRH